MADLEDIIRRTAHEAGFAMAGFARVERLAEREEFYARWLNEGRQGAMSYLAREPLRRINPRTMDPRYRSIVSLGWAYEPPPRPRADWRSELRGRIAAYAMGRDYHDVVLKAARKVAAQIESLRPGTVTRTYVDTGPVFEREWAARARLGWIGRNTMMLARERGSYFFLAEIFTDVELEAADAPYRDHCGTCRRCLDLCPTRALDDGYLIEPRLCISYLTIENRGPIPRELRPKIGMWLFGCDICQEVCPWNETGRDDDNYALMPYLPDVMALDAAAFSLRFTRSAVKRAKRRGLLRNAAVVLGNTGNRAAVPALARAMDSEPEALVRSHAAWALGQLGGAAARRALERAIKRETDAAVADEVRDALARISS